MVVFPGSPRDYVFAERRAYNSITAPLCFRSNRSFSAAALTARNLSDRGQGHPADIAGSP